MNYFLKINKNLFTYCLIDLIVIPFFGINFLNSFLGNIILLLFLVPLLFLLVAIISFNSYKSKIKTCSSCGAISFISNDTCINCGVELQNISLKDFTDKNPSEKTIEIKAEEIK